MRDLDTKNVEEAVNTSQRHAHQSAGSGVSTNGGHDVEQHVTLRSLRAETEIHAISQALQETGWNRKRAAKLLSISYRGLLYKIRQHNITPASGRQLATPSAKDQDGEDTLSECKSTVSL